MNSDVDIEVQAAQQKGSSSFNSGHFVQLEQRLVLPDDVLALGDEVKAVSDILQSTEEDVLVREIFI
jgi:hypothetical protein